MLYNAFWLIYTAKELGSHAKHDQSLKKMSLIYDRVFLCQMRSFRVHISFGLFISMALYDVIKGEIPYMGTSVGRARAHINQGCISQNYC